MGRIRTPKTIFQNPTLDPAKQTNRQTNIKPSPQPKPNSTVTVAPKVNPEPEIPKKVVINNNVKKEDIIDTPAPVKSDKVDIPNEQSKSITINPDNNWGTIQTIKRKSIKSLGENTIPKNNSNESNSIVLDQKGIEILIDTIVTELTTQFVRKDEVCDIITKSLQRMVMTEALPKK